MSGNACRRSAERRSTTFVPQSFASLPLQNGPADVPIEQYYCGVGRKDDSQPLTGDALFQFQQKTGVASRKF
jgi:hypothetical protein